jgi:predicted nucleotidyltransferase
MIQKSEIKTYVRKLAKEFKPDQVILFGSCARGKPGIASDVDLLVVMNCHKDPTDQAVEIRWRIPRTFPMDLLVRTPAEVRRRIAMRDSFITTIMKEGRVLYESAKK